MAEAPVATKDPERHPIDRKRVIAGALFGAFVVAVIAGGVYWKDGQLTASAAGGSLRIESEPAGADVRLNGSSRGSTPLSLTVPAGEYKLTVQHGTNVRELPVAVTNGAVTVHHVMFAATPAPSPVVETGHLSVATDPAGSQVLVDGADRGAAPITLKNLPVGQHRVVVRAKGTTYTRTVQIEAGATASLFIDGSQAPTPGSIAIVSPVPVQVFEDRRLIGTSDMDRIMLPVGEHVLDLVSDSVGFRASRTVRVAPGQTAAIAVDLPRAPLNINAVPWAEVFVDGTRVGETPLGNIPQTLGPHEILFRHPQLGERRVNTVVTLKETNRISVDMRQR